MKRCLCCPLSCSTRAEEEEEEGGKSEITRNGHPAIPVGQAPRLASSKSRRGSIPRVAPGTILPKAALEGASNAPVQSPPIALNGRPLGMRLDIGPDPMPPPPQQQQPAASSAYVLGPSGPLPPVHHHKELPPLTDAPDRLQQPSSASTAPAAADASVVGPNAAPEVQQGQQQAAPGVKTVLPPLAAGNSQGKLGGPPVLPTRKLPPPPPPPITFGQPPPPPPPSSG